MGLSGWTANAIGSRLRRWWRRRAWRRETILYEVTPRCNQRCNHCYNHWRGQARGETTELPTDRARKLIDRACKESGCTTFTFTGGEPCLREDLEILVRRARKHCPNVGLVTNGTLLDAERVSALTRAGVTLFELPLNSGRRERHDTMAGVAGCFDSVVRASVAIKRAGAGLALVFVATAGNIGDWPDVLALGQALGADGFLFNRYNAGGCGRDDPERLLPSPAALRQALAEANEHAAAHRINIGVSIPIQPCLVDMAPYPHVRFGFCPAGGAQAYYTIGPVGNVRPCNHSTTVLGNIFRNHFADMAISEKMRRFMAACPDFCRSCRLADSCRGGCKAAAEQCSGDAGLPDPFLAANLEKAVQLA